MDITYIILSLMGGLRSSKRRAFNYYSFKLKKYLIITSVLDSTWIL